MTKVNWLLRGRGKGTKEIASIITNLLFPLLHPSLPLRSSLGTGSPNDPNSLVLLIS